MNLISEVQKRLQLPIYLENDGNTAHLGAVALYDDGAVSGNTLLITVGTGIGCSIRMDGELFRTPGGIHPEIGHIPTGVSTDVICYCGKNNCMENLFSGTAINRDCIRFFNQTPEQVMNAVDDPEKMAYRESLISALTNAITEMVGIFNCEQVFISGGMKDFFAKYLIPETQKRLDQLKPIFGGTTILMPKSDVLFGCLGAALLAKNRYQERKSASTA
jgi:glucokinase